MGPVHSRKLGLRARQVLVPLGSTQETAHQAELVAVLAEACWALKELHFTAKQVEPACLLDPTPACRGHCILSTCCVQVTTRVDCVQQAPLRAYIDLGFGQGSSSSQMARSV